MTYSVATAASSGRSASAHLSDDIKRVVVIHLKPTSYDDEGFPYRFARAVLPSNSLAVVYALTKQALKDILPPGVSSEIYGFEDGIKRHAEQLAQLKNRFPEHGTKLIVCFVAVQTAQFPRTCDLIKRWQTLGATCVVGGFHVSGSISTLHDGVHDPARPDIPCPGIMPAEIQALMDAGVVIFHGEAEDHWSAALADTISGTQELLYRGGQPDLSQAPMPEFPEGYFYKSFTTEFGTVDSGRGCPFTCSFCTIINVQGRKSRYRDPAAIVRMFEESASRNKGRTFYFITDDNFVRNPQWREILKGLTALRRKNLNIGFMIEADLACDKFTDFLPSLAASGGTQIFMGVESLNPANLEEASKRQNKVERFSQLFQSCHDHGILVHAGYIIGFPHDTPESVERDIEELFRLGVDQVSFFMFTLLPGSEDHVRAVAAGARIDPDFNNCDSFHANMDHPLMSREEWFGVYQRAWRQFYSRKKMTEAVKRCKTRAGRYGLLRNYAWYRGAFETERAHPMIAGFYRYRDYDDRRPGAAELPFEQYLTQEAWRHIRYVGRLLSEFYRFQQAVFEAEFAPIIAEKRHELSGKIRGVGDWLRRTFGKAMSREWLNDFWVEYGRERWRLLWKPHWHFRMLPYAFTEAVYTLRTVTRLSRLVKSATTE
ncbi:MAG: radical SAM protein [Patescibacteria group bacterium]